MQAEQDLVDLMENVYIEEGCEEGCDDYSNDHMDIEENFNCLSVVDYDSEIDDEEFEDFVKGLKMISSYSVDYEKYIVYREAFLKNLDKKVKFSTLIKLIIDCENLDFDDENYEIDTAHTIEYLIS